MKAYGGPRSESLTHGASFFVQIQVKLIAVNDSFILESNVFQILRHHFGHESFYPTLFDLFREVMYPTKQSSA